MSAQSETGTGAENGSPGEGRLSARTFIRGAIFGLAGAVMGQLAAPRVLSYFDEAPVWVAPAVIIGAVALSLTVFLLIPQFRRGRKH